MFVVLVDIYRYHFLNKKKLFMYQNYVFCCNHAEIFSSFINIILTLSSQNVFIHKQKRLQVYNISTLLIYYEIRIYVDINTITSLYMN